jgi:hypothetical protein
MRFWRNIFRNLQNSSNSFKNCDIGGIGAFCAKIFKNCDLGRMAEMVEMAELFQKLRYCRKWRFSTDNLQNLRFRRKIAISADFDGKSSNLSEIWYSAEFA